MEEALENFINAFEGKEKEVTKAWIGEILKDALTKHAKYWKLRKRTPPTNTRD